ncbi:MAG: 50S ribosomal protein L29 [Acidilobaceae archaeon]
MAKYKLKPEEIRGMPIEKRRELIEQYRRELVSLRLKAKQGALKETARIRELRRNIARILTVTREEESKKSS